MKIIKPSATLMEHNLTPYQFIERVGRICYKSEDKIAEGSDERFVRALVKSNHWAMLEHETLYLTVSEEFMEDFLDDTREYLDALKYINITNEETVNIISGSFRSFHDLFEIFRNSSLSINFIRKVMQSRFPLVFGEYDNETAIMYDDESCILYTRQEFVEAFTSPHILFKHLTHTFLFVCDRGVSHEFVRHRVASFAQESTRYCNYNKDGEVVFIEPFFFANAGRDNVEKTDNWSERYGAWRHACEVTEESYLRIIRDGGTPQEARSVLPNSLKTELVITATESEWQHIVNLRYLGITGAPHPQMKEAMSLVINDLTKESGGRIKQ